MNFNLIPDGLGKKCNLEGKEDKYLLKHSAASELDTWFSFWSSSSPSLKWVLNDKIRNAEIRPEVKRRPQVLVGIPEHSKQQELNHENVSNRRNDSPVLHYASSLRILSQVISARIRKWWLFLYGWTSKTSVVTYNFFLFFALNWIINFSM